MHGVVGEDKTVNELHQNSERFDRKTELSFKYLQVGWQPAHGHCDGRCYGTAAF
jgi:hypothetical protein